MERKLNHHLIRLLAGLSWMVLPTVSHGYAYYLTTHVRAASTRGGPNGAAYPSPGGTCDVPSHSCQWFSTGIRNYSGGVWVDPPGSPPTPGYPVATLLVTDPTTLISIWEEMHLDKGDG